MPPDTQALAAFANAQAPGLTSVTRISPDVVRPGQEVQVDWTTADTDVTQAKVVFKSPSGHNYVANAMFDQRSMKLTLPTTGLTNGKYVVDWITVYDSNNNHTSYYAHGMVSTYPSAATPAAPVNIDFEQLAFTVTEPVTVTPAPVTFRDEYGTDNDTFTIPTVEGVEYFRDGKVVAPGAYPGKDSVAITARATAGYVLIADAPTSWRATFAVSNAPVTLKTQGAIGRLYERIKDLTGDPTTNEVAITGGASQEFQKATIYWSSATGAQLVKGGIRGTYKRTGATVTLGFPVSGEQSNGIGGAYQSFQKGKILWSSKTGARALRGAIGSRFTAMGNEKGALGYPITDERSNGIGGSYQVFQKGKIYWSSKTGAHAVKGAIGNRWAALGYERGWLGYPTSGEYSSGGMTVQNYQGGQISWSSRTGTVVRYR